MTKSTDWRGLGVIAGGLIGLIAAAVGSFGGANHSQTPTTFYPAYSSGPYAPVYPAAPVTSDPGYTGNSDPVFVPQYGPTPEQVQQEWNEWNSYANSRPAGSVGNPYDP